MNQKNSRRQFLKGAVGGLGGLIGARVVKLFPEVQPLLAQSSKPTPPFEQLSVQLEVGELYSGFLLLPEGFPMPAFVSPPKMGPPVICGAGQKDPDLTGYGTLYPTPAEVAKSVDFSLNSFITIPSGIRASGGNVIRHNTGEIYAVSLDYESFNEVSNLWETIISIWAQPDFHKPYPLWSSSSIEEGGPNVVLEKVDFLPTPGIRTKSQGGYVFYWIQNDILYTLIQETDGLNAKSDEPLAPIDSI